MQKLRDYLIKEGWKKDLEETLSEDRPLSMYHTAKDVKDITMAAVMTPISFCVVLPVLTVALSCGLTYCILHDAYMQYRKEKD